MAKYVTRKIINRYQKVMQQVNTDLGRTVYIYVQTGPNPEITPWDSGTNEPVNPQDWPDRDNWYTYTEYRIENVSIIWGNDSALYLPGGVYDPYECELTVRLSDVLIDKADVNGRTYFDIMDYALVDGQKCVKQSVNTKMGLKDLYMGTIVLTSKIDE